MKHHGSYARRGTGYLLVLGAAMLVSVIGLTALATARIENKSQQAACNAARAQIYARSAVEIALAYTYSDTDWRAHYNTFKSLMPMNLDRGACSAAVTEADGTTLVVDSDEPVLISGIGTVGSFAQPQAVYKWSVAAHQPALDVLKAAAHSDGPMYVSGTVTVEDAPLSTNQTLTNSGVIKGDVEARALSNTGTITGSVTLDTQAKSLPSVTVLDYYRNRATTLSSLLVGSKIEWALLSPQSNPYGTVNSNGLYSLRPSGSLTMRNTRVVGTMVIEMPSGKTLTLDQGLLWEPVRADYPALIVTGDCIIDLDPTLNESNIFNFNPAGTPYEDEADTDKKDSYPSSIKGLLHLMGTSATAKIYGSTHILGTVVCEGRLELYDGTVLTGDLGMLTSPPVKYRSSWLVLDQGTWNRVLP